ncbi:MAG: glycosyltransferase family 4 protein [Patescibacteria group bacterium]
MKILTGIDIPFNPFGGSPIIVDDWYSNLPKGNEILFLTMPSSDGKKWWKMKQVYFLKTKKEKDPKFYQGYIHDLNMEVKKVIEMYKPDIIHLQHINFGLSRSFCEVGGNIPKLAFCHGTDTQYASKNEFFLSNLKYIADRSDILVFPTINMKNDFQKLYGHKFSFKVVPHGIPEKLFKRSKIHKKGKLFKLMYAGRLNTFKGADIAVGSLRYLQFPIKLDVYGREDEEGYVSKIKKTVDDKNLQNKVSFHDMVSRKKLWRLFQKYDAIAIPSRSLEAFSITSIEAQATGIVVIYGNGGGIVNVVGNSGIMIKNNSPRYLANILKTLYKNPEVLKKYRKLGYKNAKKYKLRNQIKEMLILSKLLINGTKIIY